MVKNGEKKRFFWFCEVLAWWVVANEDEQQIKEPQIICSMGLKN